MSEWGLRVGAAYSQTRVLAKGGGVGNYSKKVGGPERELGLLSFNFGSHFKTYTHKYLRIIATTKMLINIKYNI